jgi:hypothetical protein
MSGSVPYFNGSNLAATNVGNAGDILTSTAGGAPIFQANPAGSTWLSTTFASGGNYIISLPGTYYSYLLNFVALQPNTNGDFTELYVSDDGGSTYYNSGMLCGLNTAAYNSATLTNHNSTTKSYISGPVHSSGVGFGATGTVFISNRAGFVYTGNCSYLDTTLATQAMAIFGGTIPVVSTPTNIKITSPTSGQLSFGFVYLYGLTQ